MTRQDSESGGDPLSQLAGRELSAVVFVRDYLQLQFDGPVLTITARVTVKIEERVFGMEDTGFKDALVAHIGHTVECALVHAGEAVSIRFGGHRELLISLHGEDRGGCPEAAILNLPGGVWNTYS